MSYPAEQDEIVKLAPRRNTFRRRNGGANVRSNPQAQELKSLKRPEEPLKKKFAPSVVPAPARFLQIDPAASKRRTPTYVEAPVDERQDNYQLAASNSYEGYGANTYDDAHLKFEQGVQSQANSYNSDHVI